MKNVIGSVSISFNKNTKKLYTSFSPSFGVFQIGNEVDCEKCEDEFIQKEAQKVVAKWFSSVNEIEEADIAEHPIKLEILQKKNYVDGGFKSAKIEIYQE